MKTCKLCNETKPIDEFYEHSQMPDGHLNHCKACRKQYEKNRRQTEGELVRLRDRINYRLNPEKKLEAMKRWASNNREKSSAIKAKWDLNNPFQKRAIVIANNAVRDGRIERKPCEICGLFKAHKHHKDYSKPLDVIWLCPKHHKAEHAYPDREMSEDVGEK